MSADDKHALTSYVREETVSDLGRETTSLFHNFGSDITRRDNISLIDDDTIVYPVGNTVVFEELGTGNKRYLLGLDDGGVGCVAVHPSKTMFAVGGKGFQPKIYIYSYPVLKIVRVLSGGAERGYSSLSYNVHGTKLASVATAPDYMLTVWDWDKELIELHSKAFGQDVFTVKFSKDDDRRLTTCGAGHIRFWKMASTFTGLKLQGYIGKFGKVELSDVVAIEELPDGKVVSGTETGALLLWEGNFIKCRFVQVGGKKCHEGEVTYINLDREEKALITAAADGYIRWWDASAIDAAEVDTDITMDFELLPIAEYKLIEGTKVHSIVDCGSKGLNRRIVVSDGNGRMQTVTFQLTASNDYNSNEEEEDVNALMAAGNFVGSLSRSVAKLASTSAEELEQFAPESKVLEEFHADTITAICASPYVHVCATASLDGTIRVWNYTTKTVMCTRSFKDAQVCSMKWCSITLNADLDKEGKHLLAGFSDGIVRILYIGKDNDDNATLRNKMVLKPHSAEVVDVCFSDDSTYMASTSKDGTVFLFKTHKLPLDKNESTWIPIRFFNIAPNNASKNPPYCTSLQWHASSTKLLCVCSDGILREVDVTGLENMIEGDVETYEHAFPMCEFGGRVPQLTNAATASQANLNSNMPPSQATGGEVTEGGVSESKSGDIDGSGDSGGEAGSGPETASPTESAPVSPSKVDQTQTQGGEGEAGDVVSYASLKVHSAMYRKSDGLIYVGATSSQNKNYLFVFEQIGSEQDPVVELVLGHYSHDGKQRLKNSLPTYMGYSVSNNFILVGCADGSVIMRPAAYDAVFARISGHNLSTTAIAMSYDDKYVLSGGSDGVFSIYSVDIEAITNSAESRWKDLDAGLFQPFDTNTAKMKAIDENQDESVAAMISDTDAVVSPRSAQAPTLASAPEDVADPAPDAYNIQDAKLKSEMDRQLISAEEVKDKTRVRIKGLQREFELLVSQNNNLPEAVRVTEDDLVVDKEYFATLKAEGEEMIAEVHRAREYESEMARTLVNKIRARLMKGLLVEDIRLSSFDYPNTGQSGNTDISSVNSIRTFALQPNTTAVIEQAKAEMKESLLHDTAHNLLEEDSAEINARAMNVAEMLDAKMKKEKGEGDESKTLEELPAASQEARREMRRLRKLKLIEHKKEEPKDNEDDERDVNAINHASRTIGDYKLKYSSDYEVSEDEHVDASKKMVQMSLLEDSMVKMRLGYNERFLGLRDLKKEIIYAVRRSNDRIREIDVQLGESENSQALWTPSVSASEYPEDRGMVTEAELEAYGQLRKDGADWGKVCVAGKSVDLFTNKHVPKVAGTDEYMTDMPISTPYKTNLDITLEPEGSTDVIPQANTVIKTFEVNDIPLKAYIADSEGKEATRLRTAQDRVPALAAILRAKQNFTLVSATNAKLAQQQEERKTRLRFERSKLLLNIQENVTAFKEAIDQMRVDRSGMVADLKLAELKLLSLFQEYTILLDFEKQDNMLAEKQKKAKSDAQNINSENKGLRVTLDSLTLDNAELQEKVDEVQSMFEEMLPDSHPYYDQLRKIYKKVVRKNQVEEDDDEDEDSEDEDEDEEDDEDLDDIDDSCPPGCDPTLHERILELREQKQENNDNKKIIQKKIDDTNRAIVKATNKLKQVEKDIQQSAISIKAFQLEKQAALNEIEVFIPLSLNQVHMFRASGAMTGPDQMEENGAIVEGTAAMTTDGAKVESNEADAPVEGENSADVVDLTLLTDPSKRTVLDTFKKDEVVLFPRNALKSLQDRIGGLKQETIEARKEYSQLRKERVVLSKARDQQNEKIASWKKRCKDLQILKFGKEIDLDDLEAASDRSKEQEAEAALKEQEKKSDEIIHNLVKEGEVLREKLAKIMTQNTNLLNEVGDLSEQRLKITRELNAPGTDVSTESSDEGAREREERRKVIAYVQLQAREIEALRAELVMLKRKEAPQLSAVAPPQAFMQGGGSQAGQSSQGMLPPIPGAQSK